MKVMWPVILYKGDVVYPRMDISAYIGDHGGLELKS